MNSTIHGVGQINLREIKNESSNGAKKDSMQLIKWGKDL